MNAPIAHPLPPYRHTPLFPLGADTTPYRKLDVGGVRVERAMGRDFLLVERETLRALAEAAFVDINHLLRPAHLRQLRRILDDPEASANDKFVAYDFLKNANIAAGGVLPMCQDTGTAIIMGKRGRLVFTAGDDEAALAEGARDAYLRRICAIRSLRRFPCSRRRIPARTFRRRSRYSPKARTNINSSSLPRAEGRPTSHSCFRRRRRSSRASACWPSSRRRSSRSARQPARRIILPSSSAAPAPSLP